MNASTFKKLIKEAVREVVREELPVLMLENQVRIQKLNESIELKSNNHVEPWSTIKRDTSDVLKKPPIPSVLKGSAFDDLLADAAANIQPGQIQSMMG